MTIVDVWCGRSVSGGGWVEEVGVLRGGDGLCVHGGQRYSTCEVEMLQMGGGALVSSLFFGQSDWSEMVGHRD